MNDEQPSGTPWMKNLMIWGGVFLALMLVVSMFNTRGEAAAQQITYSEFRAKVQAGQVASVQVGETRIVGKTKDDKAFTTIPLPNDPSLPELLQSSGVKYDGKSPEESSLFVVMLVQILPVLLFLGLAIFVIRQMQKGGGAGGAMGFGKSKAKMLSEKQGRVTFADVAGIDEAREELEEIVDFLKDPQRFSKLGGQIPKGALLVGQPGTGKTLLARAIAGEAGVPFFTISGSDFVEMFVGVGAARVRDLFQQAKAEAPAIIFVDEIDAVGRHRGQGLAGSNDEREQTLNQLLVEMDGFDNTTGVIVIAGTNRVDVLDSALLRPGRFDRQIVLDRPDVAGRQAILAVHAKDRPFASDVDLKVLARRTPGFTGADLANALNEAAIFAARRSATEITMHDLTAATERVLGGPERRSKVLTEADKRVVAFHEAGHALVGHMTGGDTIHKVSIIARGQALGLTIAVPETDRVMHRRSELVGRIAMLFGGRCAEELVLGESTSGASDDILRATEIAKMMVTQFGMSDAVGLRQIGPAEPEFGAARDHGEAVAALVDTEINRLLDEGRQQAAHIVLAHRDRLELIAEQLIEQETLDEGQLAQFFAGLVPSNS